MLGAPMSLPLSRVVTFIASALIALVPLLVHANEDEVFELWQGPTPALRTIDTDAKARALSDLKGRVVVLNFWASWCPVCKEEKPVLKTLQKQWEPKGVQFVGINSGDDIAKAKRAVKRDQVEYAQWLDEKEAIGKAWKVDSFPTTIIIDRNGKARYFVSGAIETDDLPEFKKILESLLK
jgi:thiol-disulfide isomerase/thioredoxin